MYQLGLDGFNFYNLKTGAMRVLRSSEYAEYKSIMISGNKVLSMKWDGEGRADVFAVYTIISEAEH